MRRRILVFAGLLSGCKMIDQRTFDPQAGRAPEKASLPALVATPPKPASGPQPLVTIPLEPPTDYDGALHDAVAAAFARNRRSFEVRAVVAPDAGDARNTAVSDAAGRVARLITAQGGRTSLSGQSDPAAIGPTVLVFVR